MGCCVSQNAFVKEREYTLRVFINNWNNTVGIGYNIQAKLDREVSTEFRGYSRDKHGRLEAHHEQVEHLFLTIEETDPGPGPSATGASNAQPMAQTMGQQMANPGQPMAPMAGQPPVYGAQPGAAPAYGGPPPAQGYGGPPPAQGYACPPPAQGYGCPPPAQGYGAPAPGYQGRQVAQQAPMGSNPYRGPTQQQQFN